MKRALSRARATCRLGLLFLVFARTCDRAHAEDFAPGSTIDLMCNTQTATAGPTAVVGGSLTVYKANDTTQSSAGVTYTSGFDGVVGYNNAHIDTTADATFYAAGFHYDVVFSAGTVGGISIVGISCGDFTLSAGAALRPSTAGRTVSVSVAGEVTVGTNNDKTGYRLSATGIDDVWDEPIAGHLTVGSTGAALNAAGASGDPWATTLPGSYTGQQAGAILATRAPSGTTVTVTSPAAPGSPTAITITQGNDYSSADGLAIDLQYSGSAILTSATASFTVFTNTPGGNRTFTSSVIGSASPYTVRTELTAAQSRTLPIGTFRCSADVVTASVSHRISLPCTITVQP